MRNSAAIQAGVPAPFTDLTPLREYIDRLKAVVDAPTPENVAAYVACDLAFAAVADISRSPWATVYSDYRPNIFSDELTPYADMGYGQPYLRKATQLILVYVAKGLTESGALPEQAVREAFELIDQALVDILSSDQSALEFARRRIGLELLNVWISVNNQKQKGLYWIAGDADEAIRNVATGWSVWGAPYGGPFFAKMTPDRRCVPTSEHYF